MPQTLPSYIPQVVLGTDTQTRRPFTLAGGSLAAHKLITGITGRGKSKFICSLAVQLLNQQIPICIIDPHSDLCMDVLKTLSATGFFSDERAFQRLYYLDFSHKSRHVPFNILKQPYPPHHIASGLFEAWTRAWSSLEGGNAVNLENILKAATYVLIINHRPLTDLQRLLSDSAFRGDLLRQVDDPQIVEFFHSRFDTWSRGRSSTLTESTLRRSFLLTYDPALRFSLGQQENILDFRRLMETKTSLLCDLGGLDLQTKRFLGCLITIGFETAALSRAHSSNRAAYHLFLDEFTSYCAQSGQALENILTQARKFGLSLGLITQTMAQTKDIRDVLQNTLHVSFGMGTDDSATLAPHFMDYTKEKPSLLAQLFGSAEQPLVDDGQKRIQWAQLLKGLKPQEALVYLSGKTFKICTLDVPEPTLPAGELARIKNEYARRLLTPQEGIFTAMRSQTSPLAVAPPVIEIATYRRGRQSPPAVTPVGQSAPPQQQLWEELPDTE